MRRRHLLARFLKDQTAATAVEYALVLGLIILAVIAVFSLGQSVLGLMEQNAVKIEPALGGQSTGSGALGTNGATM